MTEGAYSILSYVDTSKLTDDERAELERLQVEINETVARIQTTHVYPWRLDEPFTPTPVEYVDRDELAQRYAKTSAWTDEERADMAKQREADNADAYERGLDGKPLVVRITPERERCVSCGVSEGLPHTLQCLVQWVRR